MAQVKAGSYKYLKNPFNTVRLTHFGYSNAQLTGCNALRIE